MKPSPSLEPLFTAFQRINARAFTDDTLLSCPNLAKSPSYGDVLERYFGHLPPPDASFACSLLRLGRYVFAGFAHFMFLLLTRLFCIVQGWNLPPPLRENKKQHRVLIIDTFALIPKTAAQGHYTELYLPGLAGAAKHHYTVCHLFRLHGSRNPLALWRALKALKEKPCALTEAQLLRWNDWFKLLRHIAVYPLALHGLIVSLRNYSPGSPEAAIRDALTETAGQCVLSGEARRLAGYRLGLLCGAGNNASAPLPKIISWYENQTTNKTLNRGLHLAFRRTGKKSPS